MLPELTVEQQRVIGCLIEKAVITPDQYPLTLNALVAACNQKTAREPVMHLTQGQVEHTLRTLQDRHLVMTNEQFKGGRVPKYSQRFCNTRYSQLQFDDAELAIVCLLLLRGPQTPGELRARSGRLHSFEDNAAVVTALSALAGREPDPVVAKLPRRAGRKDSEYVHLFGGPEDYEARRAAAEADAPAAGGAPGDGGTGSGRVTTAELLARIERLEEAVAALREKLP